ncbi:AAA family ATPase [Streptosporangium amethystogenes]|uniref:AAA family ATPase n=1 Tax=Streptosporangium amethystogenes TaxID=2002 RepID=UPI00378D3C95
MYVANLKISGVRGFSGPRKIDLDFARREDGTYAGWTVLAGRNGSGKTTVLQALALVLAEPLLRGVVDTDTWPGFSTPAHDGEIAVELAVSAGFDIGRDSTDLSLSLLWEGTSPDYGILFSERPDEAPPWELRPHQGWLLAGYGPFRRLSAARLTREDTGQGSRRAGLSTLFDEDEGLVEGISWLLEQHLYRLEGKAGAAELLATVLELLGDGLLPDGSQIFRVNSDGLWVRRSNREFPLRRMSDGYRTVTALVLDIVRQMHVAYGTLIVETQDGHPTLPYPGVVLIDEVDAHLHVSWQQKIGEWLKTHFPRIQFIVTTHSPYICQSASPGGLIRLPGPDEEDSPRVVDENLHRRIVYGSGDDTVVTELFGVESPYSPRSDELREDLGDLEIKVLEGVATPTEIEEYRRLSQELASSPATRVREVSQTLGYDS